MEELFPSVLNMSLTASSEAFLAALGEALGRTLRPRKSGPKGPRWKELNR